MTEQKSALDEAREWLTMDGPMPSPRVFALMAEALVIMCGKIEAEETDLDWCPVCSGTYFVTPGSAPRGDPKYLDAAVQAAAYRDWLVAHQNDIKPSGQFVSGGYRWHYPAEISYYPGEAARPGHTPDCPARQTFTQREGVEYVRKPG